ncbi:MULTISPECIES: SCO family protein [Natrialbaceae]|nr:MULTISPECIES: SCO family protein [Natrialbaceae]SIS09752.1 protein SCO1/2 [Natronorubrum daqingense]
MLTGTLAGCSDILSLGSTGANDNVVLDLPEEYDQRSEADLPYPIHGEELPAATAPAPLHDREVSTREFVGDRHVMLTGIFTRCSEVCPRLVEPLVQAQAASIKDEFADEFAFLPITFDPEYDTPEQITEYSEERGADLDIGNWWFLRPESRQRAEEVTDTFGVLSEFVPEDDREMENMAWVHNNVVILANADGYVERTYTREPPNPATALEDVETLRERW